MTCNQLIVLCEIRRGSNGGGTPMGTIQGDLEMLSRKCLITYSPISPPYDYILTDLGIRRLKAVLELL